MRSSGMISSYMTNVKEWEIKGWISGSIVIGYGMCKWVVGPYIQSDECNKRSSEIEVKPMKRELKQSIIKIMQ